MCYHSSILDANLLQAGENFEEQPETYVIFIKERDVLKEGLTLYRVDRCILETNKTFGDGSHILYVNGEYRDETPLGKLMHDFSCTESEKMNYQVLAERAKFFTEDMEGVGIMCKLLEDMRNEAIEEGKREGIEVGKKEGVLNTVRCLIADGTLPLEKIVAFAGLTYDEVKRLQRTSKDVTKKANLFIIK